MKTLIYLFAMLSVISVSAKLMQPEDNKPKQPTIQSGYYYANEKGELIAYPSNLYVITKK